MKETSRPIARCLANTTDTERTKTNYAAYCNEGKGERERVK